jgi:uncharacterized 2Fe-2S/4Fe-4S cluster protein (DUF4445 family)
MRETEVLVSFRPSSKEVYVLRGTRLVEAAAGAGIVLELPCGGEGICGKCRVKVAQGAAEPTATERRQFSPAELQAGWRLACQSPVCGPTEVEIPATSLAAAQHKILVQTEGATAPASDDPPVRKRYVELAPPARGDDAADMLRLERALEKSGTGSEPCRHDAARAGSGEVPVPVFSSPLTVDLPLLRELPARLRELDFRGTAVLDDGRLMDFEAGNTVADAFAVALDIGTTTLVAMLLDLGTGSEWAVASRINPQTRFGDDVLSRILHVRQIPDGLRQLHEAIVLAVDEMLGELCRQAGIPRERIYELTFAGNTTMQQLLCGVDPSWLGEVPFVPAGGRGLVFRAAELGLHIHPRGIACVLPVIGSFVGGDTVAGILATGLADAAAPTLLVDIGTNGEIVLMAGGKLSAASTAAGPAFEGARISCGMRGSAGAIEKVAVDGRLRINVIGNVPPLGLCGSGLIDVAAELLRHRVLAANGKLHTPDQLPGDLLPDLAQRVVLHDGQVSFQLAAAAETAQGQPIQLTQRDLRELQLATGAIRAGITILLRRAGLKPDDLDRVLMGGGFGNFIRRSNAQRIGLLPSRIEHRRIRYMGNTALAGARLAALSRRARALADELALRTEHVDLSADAEFHRCFAESMIFPET